MISEGSFDTEDWNNVCFVITEINSILKYIKIKNSIYFILDQINAAVVSIRDFFQKHYQPI